MPYFLISKNVTIGLGIIVVTSILYLVPDILLYCISRVNIITDFVFKMYGLYSFFIFLTQRWI